MPDCKTWYVIVNPASGNGAAKKQWHKIQSLLKDYGFEFKHVFTEYSNHSVELVHLAVENGFRHFISIGGDGTLHNIVNGIMTQRFVASNIISVGVIPIGTGNDWVKTHSIPKSIDKAISIIKDGNILLQDIGKIELLNENKGVVYFNNLAGVGFDGYVVSKVERYKRYGVLAYLIGTLMGLSSFKNFNSSVTVNEKTIKSKSLMVLIGLCIYSGGGMQLTKSPNAFDGRFDISIAKDFKVFDILINVAKLFNGKIVNYKKVECLKSQSIEVNIDNDELPFIEADGELIGKGGFKASIIPKAFAFYAG